jgi:sulfite oxidase
MFNRFAKFARRVEVKTAFAALTLGSSLGAVYQINHSFSVEPVRTRTQSVSECQSALPVYRKTEVQRQARENKKVWVTYRDGVYDLELFVKNHPGGSDKLMMAIGGPIEPWW